MMWWSGLRGAMAFALAVDASETFGEAGQVRGLDRLQGLQKWDGGD